MKYPECTGAKDLFLRTKAKSHKRGNGGFQKFI